MQKIKCYHYRTGEFYKTLLKEQCIIANNQISLDVKTEKFPEDYVKEYVFIKKNINGGNGMFFTWSNPEYKGKIVHDDSEQFFLLELEVEEDICIKTHYENWCSLGVDLFQNDGDINETDEYCKEIGIADGLDGSYNCIYDISDTSDEIQILLPYINAEWIKSAIGVKERHI